MNDSKERILGRLLERLYVSLVQGPCLNCRLHRSRQRMDWSQLDALGDLDPAVILSRLLTENNPIQLKAKVGRPTEKASAEVREAYDRQQNLLTRLRDLAEDALDYERETGENALYLGYPMLSIPPGLDLWGDDRKKTPRVLAPAALIPIDIHVHRGAQSRVTLAAKGEGSDFIIPNHPLLAWLEQQTGRDTADLFADDEGAQPYKEINHIVGELARHLEMPVPDTFAEGTGLLVVPKADELPDRATFLPSAVLGLFPVSNQGLLRDLQAMTRGEPLQGPVELFLSPRLEQPVAEPMAVVPPAPKPAKAAGPRDFSRERLVAAADPCQARAVRLSEENPVLVIHGPPGTGKSQTITNIIADHLGRGERVLMVCDKRTALDVVHNRLEHLGLGDLCAVVHDAQRDQAPLYKKLKEWLDGLSDRKTDAKAPERLQRADQDLGEVHAELKTCFAALLEAGPREQRSFHDMVGEWMALAASPQVAESTLVGADLEAFENQRGLIEEILSRGRRLDFPNNPWPAAVGMNLDAYLARPVSDTRDRIQKVLAAARNFDTNHPEGRPPLDAEGDLATQARNRETLADDLDQARQLDLAEVWERWQKAENQNRQARDRFQPTADLIPLFREKPLEADLKSALGGRTPALAEINRATVPLQEYLAIARKWYAFFCFGRKKAAALVLIDYGLTLSPESAERALAFYTGIQQRLQAQAVVQEQLDSSLEPAHLLADADLIGRLERGQHLLDCVVRLQGNAAAVWLQDFLATALRDHQVTEAVALLRSNALRAEGLVSLLATVRATGLFGDGWIREFDRALRSGIQAAPRLMEMAARQDSLEDVLRLNEARRKLPVMFQAAAERMLDEGLEAEPALCGVRRTLLAAEISRRIRQNPALKEVDQERMESLFRKYRRLEKRKADLVRESILHRWVEHQKERLLAGTRTQLNSAGASLKRRLISRGKRAVKLRQMIRMGLAKDEPDPLFDVCPVWLASPATVALIFPREPLFDVLIFDEASQCRLEEAIPVLTRGRRVVIAGDPKQLPPTRFFESVLPAAELEELETEDDFFEFQQGETEDLLSAALNLDVRQCYLDVHYRSRHDDLIGFSNRYFYGQRLQAIPAPPSRRAGGPPICLERVDGQYLNRGNPAEAEAVVARVQDLLAQSKPPSIGIACFNLVQRDLILDRLEELAEADAGFAASLDTARNRVGEGSYEGLFVKNLENVQGDERDHMIISTTFGPDKKGAFRRNFGPLGRQGGGRRLNVLVTRAREKIHVFTSIPRTEYAALAEMEKGQSPNGRWLLYAYLKYTEELAEKGAGPMLEQGKRQGVSESVSEPLDAATALAEDPDPCAPAYEDSEAMPRTRAGRVEVRAAVRPSPLAEALARSLAKDFGTPAEVHWGNEGFCIDIALASPGKEGQPKLGVLCDMTRYAAAEDPVEWDVFRTAILQDQGWKFHRIWSPGLFLDPDRHCRQVADKMGV